MVKIASQKPLLVLPPALRNFLRHLRNSILAFITSLALIAPISASATEHELVISVYGFAQDAFKEILYDPFEKKCGCNLVVETGNSIERLAKMEAHKDDPAVDVAVMAHFDALAAARKGLIQPIEVSKLSNHRHLYDLAKDPIGDHMAIGYTFYATSIVYRTDKVKVNSWGDLLAEDLSGRVAFPNISVTQAAPSLFMLGKALDNDAPDFNAPIASIADHKDNFLTFYERSSQLIQLLEQDELWAAPVGRFVWSRIAGLGLPIEWANPTEGQSGGINVMVMTKGNNNEELALEFMDYWLSSEIQTALANALVDSPANKQVDVSSDIAENLTYGEETVAGLKIVPADVVLDNRADWLENWNNNVTR